MDCNEKKLSVSINGVPFQLMDRINVEVLLAQMGYSGKRVAIEKNGVVVPKSEHALTKLKCGDRIEIVFAVGGG